MLTIDYNLLGIKDGERVLDIGCGEGRHSWEACRKADCLVYALDIEMESLNKTRWMLQAIDNQGDSNGRWVLIKGNTMSLPFQDASFDKIICSEVLEHVPDDQQSIREMARVLKDDGVMAISVPTYFTEAICWKLSRDYHDQPGGHVRIYRTGELVSPLRQNNFHIYATRHKHALHSIYWISRCLFGVNREKALIPSLYHKFLVWDIKTKSRPIRLLENFLNHFFSKSMVYYTYKNQTYSNEPYTQANATGYPRTDPAASELY